MQGREKTRFGEDDEEHEHVERGPTVVLKRGLAMGVVIYYCGRAGVVSSGGGGAREPSRNVAAHLFFLVGHGKTGTGRSPPNKVSPHNSSIFDIGCSRMGTGSHDRRAVVQAVAPVPPHPAGVLPGHVSQFFLSW
jgi:hypothetical protein